jgi:hypothetical protein
VSAPVSIEAELFARPRFRAALQAIAIRSALDDLPLIEPELVPTTVDWRFALFCASLLTQSTSSEGIDAALRVAQGCMTDSDTTPVHRSSLPRSVASSIAIRGRRSRRDYASTSSAGGSS